ncbi:MAG: hypothetical protein NZ828_06950 [Alphaproteobacteria bacterium]|jgi:hypothetical protein|nr:hypothetical protein [Alphaproteobacteria bacterium]
MTYIQTKLSTLLCCILLITSINPAYAQPSKSLIDNEIISNIRDFINTEIVRASIKNQNIKYNNLSQDDIDALDKKWRSETKADEKPLISAVLSNPLSSYLTRIQAHSIGLYSEMFVMDKNGLNVGQSNISSDFWQGDEGKFQKTYPRGVGAVFIDDPEYDDKLGIWRVQVNLSIADAANAQVIGAVTVEINLSELERRASI